MSKTSKTTKHLLFPTAAEVDATWEAIEKANLEGEAECTIVANWFEEVWEESEESVICSAYNYSENHQ